MIESIEIVSIAEAGSIKVQPMNAIIYSSGESMRDVNKGCVGTSIKASVPA